METSSIFRLSFVAAGAFLSSCGSLVDLEQVRAGLIGENVDVVTARLGRPTNVQNLSSSQARVFIYQVKDNGDPCTPEEHAQFDDWFGKDTADVMCAVRASTSQCHVNAIVRSDNVIADVFLRNPNNEHGGACQALFARMGFQPPA